MNRKDRENRKISLDHADKGKLLHLEKFFDEILVCDNWFWFNRGHI